MSILKSNYFCFFVALNQILVYSICIGRKADYMSDDLQKKIFSHNLLGFLSLSGKSQKEVADAIGVSPQTFNTWCQGIALPRMGKIQALADYFSISKSDLLDNHKHVDAETYYLNDDARDMAQFLFENPEYKVLFDASRKVSKEDIATVKAIMDRFGSN